MNPLPITGERMIPGEMGIKTEIEHLHRYAIAQQFCQDKDVLDIASGEGYGSWLLSQKAKKVIGVDIDPGVIKYAGEKYKKNNLSFKCGSADKIPIEDNSVDAVISFETIEHHDRHDEMMQEIKRVLRSDGFLLISTPDKEVYSNALRDNNPHHVKELDKNEFLTLLKGYFTYLELFGQSAGIISVFYPVNGNSITDKQGINGSVKEVRVNKVFQPEYLIALASQSPIEARLLSIFDGNDMTDRFETERINTIKNSRTYRLGNIITFPFRWLRNIFK